MNVYVLSGNMVIELLEYFAIGLLSYLFIGPLWYIAMSLQFALQWIH